MFQGHFLPSASLRVLDVQLGQLADGPEPCLGLIEQLLGW